MRSKACPFALAVMACVLAAAVVYAAPAPSFRVSGAVAKPTVWTAARLAKDPPGGIRTVHYVSKGIAHTARCVSLLAIIQAAQPRYNPHIKNHRLQFVVAVQGFDGYTADFSLAELLPEIGNRAAWVALDEDGKPLSGESGPVQLIVPGDTKPGRWVHGVVAVAVTDGAQ